MYTDLKKRYYLYRIDDILDYLPRDATELDKLFKQESKMFNNLKETLTPEQQNVLFQYSNNRMDLLTEGVDELTQQILKDFEKEK